MARCCGLRSFLVKLAVIVAGGIFPEAEACLKQNVFLQAAHVVIYADTRTPAVQKLAPRAAVYLQFRFDGHVGFPGGMLNRGERPEDAAYRELTEESGLDSEELRLTKDDLLVVHYSKSKNLLLHLFVKKVSSSGTVKSIDKIPEAKTHRAHCRDALEKVCCNNFCKK